MGFFDSFNKLINESGVMGPTVSGPETNLIFYSQAKGEIRKDKDFIKEFNSAHHGLLNRRREDTYLQSISGGSALEATIIRIDKYDGHAIRWQVRFACGKTIKLWLVTDEAIQLTREGKPLYEGYSVAYNHEEKQKAEQNAKEKRRQRPAITSFLGIKFFTPLESVITVDVQPIDLENGLMMTLAKMNQFLSFSQNFVFSAFDGDKVIGFMCVTPNDAYGNEKEFRKYGEQIVSILNEKYQREFEYNKDEKKFVMNFYRDEAEFKGLYVMMDLSVADDGDILLQVLDVDEVVKAGRRYDEMRKKLKKAKDAASRKNALDAL